MKRLIGVLALLGLISAAIFILASMDMAEMGRTEKKSVQAAPDKRIQDSQSSLLLNPAGVDSLKAISKRYEDISFKSVPSIVHIHAVAGKDQPLIIQSGAINDYYSLLGIDAESEGTGVFINDQGLILTPLHVVLSAVAIQVRTWDSKVYQAEIVSADVGTDLAILKIPLSGTRAIKWGDSATLGLGEFLVLVGADSQMNGRVSQGVVSSSAHIPPILDEGYFGQFFLVDASSNAPRSGWLVLNLDGLAVGILGQSSARIYRSEGECVALGSNQVREISEQLAQGNLIQRSYVGLQLQQLTPDLAATRKIKLNGGALVSDVLPASPADLAGILPGDVVLKVGSQAISQYAQVRAVVADLPSGKGVPFQLDRAGSPLSVTVTPAMHPMQMVATRNDNPPLRGAVGAPAFSPLEGVVIQELPDLPGTPKQPAHSKLPPQPKRITLASVDYQQVILSIPMESGILLLEVDGDKINSREDFEASKRKTQGHILVNLRVDYAGKKRYITLRSVQ